MNGWISLHRDLLEWEWYKDSKCLHLWIHLLLVANRKDGYVNGIPVKRGQRLTSLAKLSEETGLSVQEVRTALKKLESTKNVTNTSTNKYRLITVEKYGDWQKLSTGSNKQGNKQSNKLATTNNKEININKDDETFEAKSFLDILSDEDLENLDQRYERFDELINMIDDQVVDLSIINKPYSYLCRVADNQGWPKKRRLTSWFKTI